MKDNKFIVQYTLTVGSEKQTIKMSYPTLELASTVAEFLWLKPEFKTPEGLKAKASHIQVLSI